MTGKTAELRIHNTRSLLHELMLSGAMSRAEIARKLHVSKPTVGEITTELLERGLIREIDTVNPANRGRGRPSTPIQLDNNVPRILLIQIGIHETRLAATPLLVDDADDWDIATPTPSSMPKFRQALTKAIRQLPTRELLGMVISVPGLVDEPEGRSIFSPNLHWLANSRLIENLQTILAIPTVLIQEIRALALGQQIQHGDDNFLLVDVDHGLGGAAVINGRLFDAPLPIAMEIGHAQVPRQHQRCGCGGTGCLETIFSMGGLLRTWNSHQQPRFRKWEQLAEYLHNQPDRPHDWITSTLDAAGAVIGGTLNTIGTKRVVFTGAASNLPTRYQQKLTEEVSRHSLWSRLAEIECVFEQRYRMRGMVASGMDRLVQPLADSVVHHVAS